MRKFRIALLTMIIVLVLTGCSCKHEWTEADCVNPATCGKCGATEGEALGHAWTDASCTTARSCSRCGRTEGEPLGHSWADATCKAPKTCTTCGEVVGDLADHAWTEASCSAPKTCSVCGVTEGEALEHTWAEATTDTPATCTVCGAVEGEKIVTDPRFVTEEVKPLLGRWEATLDLSEEDLSIRRYNGTLEGTYWIEFHNDGTAQSGVVLKDEKAFREAVAECYADWFFERMDEEDIGEDAANKVAEELVEMDVEAYILQQQKEVPVEELIEELMAKSDYPDGWRSESVYYMADGKLYMDDAWSEEMHEVEYEMIGSTMLLYGYLEFKAVPAAN